MVITKAMAALFLSKGRREVCLFDGEGLQYDLFVIEGKS